MGYTRRELVGLAEEAGHTDVSERLVTDWCALGLLDRPERVHPGAGSGSGSRYEFPESQKDLFLELLRQRGQKRYVATLAQLPVGIWLYWGDEWVPLRQVRIALNTWWERAGHLQSLTKTKVLAKRAVGALVGDQGSRTKRERLVDEIVRSMDRQRYEVDVITPLVDDVLESLPGAKWGPFRMGTQEAVDLLRAMTVAFEYLDDFTDGAFVEVRARIRQNAVDYFRRQPHLAADPTFGHWFEDMSFSELVSRSCADLTIGLGFLRIAHDRGRPLPPVTLQRWTRPPPELLRRLT